MIENNNYMKKKAKLNYTQRFIFNLLSKIQYGKVTINDPTGTYLFTGKSGTETHAVILNINDLSVYKKLLLNGTLAAGETYMQGGWEADNLTILIEVIIKNTEIFNTIDSTLPKLFNLLLLISELFKRNNIKRAKENIIAHYDLGNDFFKEFLDPTLMYSCALFETDATNLYAASTKKLDTICQQLRLQPSDHLLEIGTGWGGLAIHAAQHYGCKVTTTTISDKQYAHVKLEIERLGLQNQIELLNKDYRLLTGQYDKLVSVEMIEAVGYQHFDVFFKRCNELVKPNGLFFLQAILINDKAYNRAKTEVDFIKKYIFPGGCLPSMGAISQSIATQTQFQLLHLRDIGEHYATTLMIWLNNFNQRLDQIRQQGFSEQFIRMWRYYLCYCEAAFRQTYITDIHALWFKRE